MTTPPHTSLFTLPSLDTPSGPPASSSLSPIPPTSTQPSASTPSPSLHTSAPTLHDPRALPTGGLSLDLIHAPSVPLPTKPTLDEMLAQPPMQVLTPVEARALATELVLVMMSCVPHGSIEATAWWTRAGSALGAGVQSGADAEGVVAIMCQKLVISEIRHEAASLLSLIYERLRAPAIFARWRAEVAKSGMVPVIVGEAKHLNATRRREPTREATPNRDTTTPNREPSTRKGEASGAQPLTFDQRLDALNADLF